MLTLDRLQHTIANAVLGKPQGSIAPLFEPGLSDPIRRLRIYQNNTRASLTSTLLVVFPVTVQLIDERFFRYAANEFIRFHPPTEPRLVRYGAAFPYFLRKFPGLAEMPFVAETARLEWAIAEALDSAALPSLPIGALSGVEEATPDIVLQPSLRFVISHWPVLSIWSAHQHDCSIEDLDVSAHRPERVALWRSGDTVRFSLLTGAQFSFRYSLKAGLGLDKAVSRAFTHEPMFDLVGALVSLFNDRLVTDVRPHASRPTAGEDPMSTIHEMPVAPAHGLIERYMNALRLADAIPLSLVQFAARVAVAHVFWQSAQTKLASWPVTLQLFAMEYRLPLIDPAIAAPLATASEIAGAVLVFLGLFARVGALVLLGVVATIQVFVYPQSWPEHLMWASLLLLILARGAGVVSLDHLAARLFGHRA